MSETVMQENSKVDTYTMQLAFAAGGYKDVILTPKTYSLRQLSERLSQVRVGPKDGAYMIRGGDLSITKRSDENLKSAELIILDGDSSFDPETGEISPGAPSIYATHEALREMGIAHIIHTSHSNRGEDGVVSFWKYRVVIPCRIADADALKDGVEYLIARLHERGVWIADVSENYRWSQPWFLPRVATEEERSRFVHREHIEGEILDIADASRWAWARRQNEMVEDTVIVDGVGIKTHPPATASVISDFNSSHGIDWVRDQLSRAGYRFSHFDKRRGVYRYCRPGSETGVAGVVVFLGSRGDWCVYSHHGAADPLSGKVSDPFSLLATLNFAGDNSQAYRSIVPREPTISEQLASRAAASVITQVEQAKPEAATNKEPAADAQITPERKLFDIVHFSDLREEPVQWLVRDLIPASGFVALFGRPGSYKSFVAMYIASQIASGGSVFGREVTKGGVLYVAAEGQGGIFKRTVALMQKYEIPQEAEFYFLRQPLNLRSSLADLDTLTESLEAKHVRPSLIILDTLARNFGNGEENSATDMGAFISVIGEMQRRIGCAVMVVHHAGKDDTKGMRGSSALLGAVDAELECVRTSDKDDVLRTGKITTTKQKDGEDGVEHHYSMAVRYVSPTDTTITSLVIEPIDAPGGEGSGAASSGRQARNRSSRVQSEAELSFSMALKEGSVIVTGVGPIPDGTRCVREEMWRNYFTQISVSEQGDAQRKAWQRAKQGMRDSGRVGFYSPYFWEIEGD